MRAGLVAVPVNFRFPADTISYIMRDAAIQAVFYDAGATIGCAVLVSSQSIYVIAIGAVIIGLSFAAVYPTTLAIAADRYERLAGTIFGLLFAMGLIGGMFFPWIVGQISQMHSVRAGMIVPLVGAIAISLLAAIQSRSRA